MKTIQQYENIAELNKNCNYERFYATRLDVPCVAVVFPFRVGRG